MHVPDGLLDTKIWTASLALSAGAIGLAARRAGQELQERQVPTLGVMAAFVFAAQMVNFPVPGGTSGHLLGAALAALTLGPWAATLVMTAVLVIQAFFFGDGGVTALGANVLTMGVVAPWTAHASHRSLRRLWKGPRGGSVARFVAAWVSVEAAALVIALMLAASGYVPLALALGALLGWHALIGAGEGLITVAVLTYLHRLLPEDAGSARPMLRGDGV
ncbi:cobalamin biosynthesis protein CbiM [Limnochorda pilosa]|uniref:Cobalamin biosynthesis protein CbiM n=2 Tax=Limnochorda pilosa TaxID=1555112 RepID=A0A0K2SHC6_LIMPI|nr:cobalamin biosynthesis protein CbiM [Limnochorda pilosa]